MIDFLQFIFSSIWRFLGVVFLLYVVAECLAIVVSHIRWPED